MRAELDVARDRLVGELVDEVRLPVPLVSRWVQPVEHALQRRVRYRADPVQERRAELLPDRREGCLGLVERAGGAPDDAAHRLPPQVLREGRRRGHGQEGEEAVELVGRRREEVPVPAQDVGGALQGPEHRPGVDGVDRVEPEEERGDDAEVAAAAAQGPEEVRVLGRAGRHEPPVGQHDVGFEEVVDRQAAGAGQVAEAAAEGEAADAGGGDDAAGGGEAEGVGGVVDVAPGAAAADAGGPGGGVDPDARHGREVDDEPAVAGAEAGAVVAAAADREEEAAVAGEADGGDDVAGVGAAGDEGGAPVDHGVEDGAGPVVARIAGLDQLPPKFGSQLIDCRRLDGRGHGVRSFRSDRICAHRRLGPGVIRLSDTSSSGDPLVMNPRPAERRGVRPAVELVEPADYLRLASLPSEEEEERGGEEDQEEDDDGERRDDGVYGEGPPDGLVRGDEPRWSRSRRGRPVGTGREREAGKGGQERADGGADAVGQ